MKEVADISAVAFNVSHVSTPTSHQSTYSVSLLPGILFRSKGITIFPKFTIVNCINSSIRVRQLNSNIRSSIVLLLMRLKSCIGTLITLLLVLICIRVICHHIGQVLLLM